MEEQLVGFSVFGRGVSHIPVDHRRTENWRWTEPLNTHGRGVQGGRIPPDEKHHNELLASRGLETAQQFYTESEGEWKGMECWVFSLGIQKLRNQEKGGEMDREMN